MGAFINDKMAAMELCRHIADDVPWSLKGSDKFTSIGEVNTETSVDYTLSLDEFSDRYLYPLAVKLVTERHRKQQVKPSWVTTASYRGCTIEFGIGYDVAFDREVVCAKLKYVPVHPDRSMGTYFWLGELAEAA